MSFTAFTGSLEVNGLSGQQKRRWAEFDQLVANFKERWIADHGLPSNVEKASKEDVGSGTDEVVVQGVLKQRDYQFQREGGKKILEIVPRENFDHCFPFQKDWSVVTLRYV